MHSSDVSEVQFVPVGMDDTVEEVRQRVAELPSFAGRVVTLHAEGVLLETGPFSATGIEDGGAVQVQTALSNKKTTLKKQFLEACKQLDKKEPDMTLLVQQLSAVERRWVASERTPTKMLQFIVFTGEDEEEESTVEEDSTSCTKNTDEEDSNTVKMDDSTEDGTDGEEEDNTVQPGSRWEDVSKKCKKLGAALQEAGFDVCCVDMYYNTDEEDRYEKYYVYGHCGSSDDESLVSYPDTGFHVGHYRWPDDAGLPEKFRTLLLNDVIRSDFINWFSIFDSMEDGIITALVFWPRRWRAKRIRRDQSFPLLEEACKGVFDPKDLGCTDIVALQEVCAASVEKWTPTLRATMLECVSQPSMPGSVAATFLTDHFTLSTISEAEVASLERLLQRDTPAINTAFLNVMQSCSGMEKAGCAADMLLRLAKKGVNTTLLKRCADCVATSRPARGNGNKYRPAKTKIITHFIITILRLLLHLDMKTEMEKVVDWIAQKSKKYRFVPVADAAFALMDDAATVEASVSLVKIAKSRLQRKNVLKRSRSRHLESEGVLLMRFIACCVDAEEGKALLKKVARWANRNYRCAAVLNGALTALKGVPALGVAPVCFPAGMCQEWVWSCLANVINSQLVVFMHHKEKASLVVFITATTLLQHLGGGAPAVQQLLDTLLFAVLTRDHRDVKVLTDAFPRNWARAVLDMIYSRCIDRLHKICPVLPNTPPKNWHLDDTLSAPCCYDCREVCRLFTSNYDKERTICGRNVGREGHVSQRVLALPGHGRTFKAEVLSSSCGVLQICKVPCGQASIEEMQQYDNDAEEYRYVRTLIEQLEARMSTFYKRKTPPSTEHDPDAEEAVQDSTGEPPLKRRRVDSAMSNVWSRIIPGYSEILSDCYFHPEIASSVVSNEDDAVSTTSESSCWNLSEDNSFSESCRRSTPPASFDSCRWAILDPSRECSEGQESSDDCSS